MSEYEPCRWCGGNISLVLGRYGMRWMHQLGGIACPNPAALPAEPRDQAGRIGLSDALEFPEDFI